MSVPLTPTFSPRPVTNKGSIKGANRTTDRAGRAPTRPICDTRPMGGWASFSLFCSGRAGGRRLKIHAGPGGWAVDFSTGRPRKVAIHVPAGITPEVLKIHFTRYLRGNHVRYIYGIVLKYTVNTGESVFFLVVGGRRVFKFRVWCACLSLYSHFLSSRPFLPPCACALSCSVHRHGPWFCAYRQMRNVTEDFE